MAVSVSRYTANRNKNTKVDLTKIKLVKNKYGYCLDVTYRVETPDEISECHIPCLHLPIHEHEFDIEFGEYAWWDEHTANIGFGDMKLCPDKDGACYTVETIETKTKEMTLEEIEKKLGHKVKIVNKK